MSTTAAESLVQQLESLTPADLDALPDDVRSRLGTAARNVSLSLENRSEAISRFLLTQPVEAITVRIAADLGVFSTLGSKTLTSKEIAQATGAQPELMYRVLRSLSAFKAVREHAPGQFSASPSYALFKDRAFEKALGPCQDVLNKINQSLPGFLAATKYLNPTDSQNTAVQYAYGTPGKGYMETLLNDPSQSVALNSFAILMSVWAEGFTQIKDLYPIEDRLAHGFDPQTVMFVDVGGGFGQKTLALKKSMPSLLGRMVVQDRPAVISRAPQDDPAYTDVELTTHDFFTEQPIKGARCYYIRQCLHDWPDSACVTILRRLREAATPGYSRILIHEIIVPETGAGPWIAAQDFTMMSQFAVGERTEADWRRICEKAGLNVTGIFISHHATQEGIVETGI